MPLLGDTACPSRATGAIHRDALSEDLRRWLGGLETGKKAETKSTKNLIEHKAKLKSKISCLKVYIVHLVTLISCISQTHAKNGIHKPLPAGSRGTQPLQTPIETRVTILVLPQASLT